ncbi:MAG: hypothetical protein ACE5FD_03530 [Anaerolineae bacterium]
MAQFDYFAAGGCGFALDLAVISLSGVISALVIVSITPITKVVGRYVRRKLPGLPPWPEEAAPVTIAKMMMQEHNLRCLVAIKKEFGR